MGLFEKLANPAGNLYLNWIQMQDYQHDFLMEMADNVLDGNLEVIEFEYIPKDREEKASMSFHLTEKEKRDILNSTTDLKNVSGIMRLKQLLITTN